MIQTAVAHDLTAVAAALVVAVNDDEDQAAADALKGLARDELRELVVLLAKHVDPDRPFMATHARRPISRVEAAVKTCVAITALRWGITVDELTGSSRRREVIDARHVAASAARFCGATYPLIGRALGGRDHTTAMHAVSRVGEDARLRRVALEVAETVGRAEPQDEVA